MVNFLHLSNAVKGLRELVNLNTDASKENPVIKLCTYSLNKLLYAFVKIGSDQTCRLQIPLSKSFLKMFNKKDCKNSTSMLMFFNQDHNVLTVVSDINVLQLKKFNLQFIQS